MALNYSQLRPIPSFLLPFTQSIRANQTRSLHHTIKAKPIPKTTPFVPNAETFLTLIGRNLSQHASKIPSWKALFSLTSPQLKELGVDPPRSRRYLLRWREKFRNGQFGIGGDLKHVNKGVAELRIAEFPIKQSSATAPASPAKLKIVVNVPTGGSATGESAEEVVPVKGLRVQGAHTIVGPHVQPLKGGRTARIEVKEGLWEDRRGHKIDGGERRQAEVRAKKMGEDKRAR
ncbi:unnamed protein product [Diplocarpon coronariae]|uniref:Small ribosomal subunit protein mS41 n=1 Tax=Diplocarpon coronariae TaxID=2795749 RepID=A0A218ZCB3_9HELO|nr:hypothetical protein B2J93_1726 [Marssonina coronariae]